LPSTGHRAGGTSRPALPQWDLMSQRNVELARRGFEAIMRGEFESVSELLAPDVRWHGGNPADGCQDRAQSLAWMQRPERRAGDLVEIVDAGERVVVIIRPRGPDGEPGEPVANLTTFRDGKVVEMVHYEDPAQALAAAGVEPTPDG
jgi:ketosteroid isomerase-like protein